VPAVRDQVLLADAELRSDIADGTEGIGGGHCQLLGKAFDYGVIMSSAGNRRP
jgi:hypothetical protein